MSALSKPCQRQWRTTILNDTKSLGLLYWPTVRQVFLRLLAVMHALDKTRHTQIKVLRCQCNSPSPLIKHVKVFLNYRCIYVLLFFNQPSLPLKLWMVLNLLKCSFVLACRVVNLFTPCNDFRNQRRTRIVTLPGRLYPCRYNYHKTCHSYGSCKRILITAILMERKREPSYKILRALHCNPLLLYVVICPPVTVEKI